MIEWLRSALEGDDVDPDERDRVVRSADEIDAKVAELDDALDDPANDFELMANRAARDALVWARGADAVDVVTDSEAYDRGRE